MSDGGIVMTKLEQIISEAGALSASERRRLIEILRQQLAAEAESDEDVGRRGLASWTESARGEDWAAYYPDDLQNGRPS